ncbi:Putative gustatory receptor 28b [Cyphomyrmex costatus]|uniref:Gustatory receptor n=1 Tax=Cyphomyrmex costatus TaxID=456900 RepID=A0A195CSR8_9HYME|nr:Putative gustatory receptor 28b [Cyphomyrmex costatus]
MRRRWSLCYATDFQSLMYPCFICNRIFGIFPYKLNGSTFEISKLCCILSITAICVCCVINFVLIYHTVKSNINFGNVIWNIQTIMYSIITSFIMIITHILNIPRMRLLQTILEVSSKLPTESYQKLSKWIHVKDISCNIIRVVHFIMYLFKVLKFEDTFYTILIRVFTIYLALLILQIILLYVNCVCVLKACFKRINVSLVNMRKFVLNDTKPRVSNVLWHRNQFSLIELRVLKKQHLMISDAVQMLNMIFNLQLLAIIVMLFLSFIFELYIYTIRWQNGVFFGMEWRSLDVLLLSMIYKIFMITLVVWACETCKNQAGEIGTAIHDFLNSTNNEKIKCELQQFSLQILHRKNTFSVKGFNIDATLLATVSKRSLVVNIKILIILYEFVLLLDSEECYHVLPDNNTIFKFIAFLQHENSNQYTI